MQELLTFDDVLLKPKFSTIKSRKDVDLTSMGLKLPVIASNMDTITSPEMAKAMAKAGGVACLHRFYSIDENVKAFKESKVKPWVSIGLGKKELERAEALFVAGAETFVIDVAHGASLEVVEQTKALNNLISLRNIVVGNFGDVSEIHAFCEKIKYGMELTFKVGIGGGSACTTRIETGVGIPTFSAVLSCRHIGYKVIADGGIKTPGDIAKAIAAGASAVMIGGMLSGTTETPGDIVDHNGKPIPDAIMELMINGKMAYKKYRGSASKESYEVQGKDESWRTAEGEAMLKEYKGPAGKVLARIEGGLRSSYSYLNAKDTKEFQENAEFVKVSPIGVKENGAHGKAG